jgi:YVTN family beta-propeller protein
MIRNKRNAMAFVGLFGVTAAALVPAVRSADTSSKGLLLVANADDKLGRNGEGYVTMIDPESSQAVAKVKEGGITAHEIVASPDGRMAFAPIYSNAGVGMPGTDGSTIAVIDVPARKLVGAVDFGKGLRPHFAVWNPKDNLIYVTTEMANSVSIVDPKTLKVVGSIPTGHETSHNVIISHDGERGYTSNVYSGTVSVLDIPGRKLVATIPVATTGTPMSKDRPNWRVQRISISNDDKWVFTADWTSSEVAAIDTATNTVKARVPIPSPGYGSVSTKDGKYLIICAETASKVAIIDLATLKVVRTIDVPPTPQEVVLRPDGLMAYVSCDKAQEVVEIRVSDWTIDKTFDTGNYPDGMAWAAAR